MVPESPSVCFRCKMCKVCFLTMNEIERHLKTTDHFIRPSSNTNSTKENSTASESSDDKPLNLSSKSAFPPLPTPTRPNDIDLKLSSAEDFEYDDDDKNVKGKNALKDAVKLKEVKSAAKVVPAPKAGFSRKASAEDSLLTENSVYMKSTTAQDDLADVETDTVSSTSSEHPPPTEKNIETPPPLETGEADVSTQFPLFVEEKSYETCSTTTQNCEKSVDRGKQGKTLVVEMVKNKETFPIALCDAETQKIEDDSMDVDDDKEKTSTPSLKSSSSPVVATSQGKVNEIIEHNEEESSRIHEDCEMSINENDEPDKPQNEEGKDSKLNPTTESNPKNSKKQKLKYRCRHCGEMFTFPVQVHTHMRKVHASASGESTTKPRRRSSANTPSNNNNNNDTAKPNVQMYPLRSLYARAKRRTRSMQSDGGGGNARRNSLGHSNNNNNNEERKEKKITTPRKAICFTCRHCGKKFPLLNQLKIHLHKIHPEKVKKAESTPNGGLRNRKHLASNRLLLASKKRRQTTPLLVQTQNRSTRVSTRSASRSADSEPETVRMSTRRRSSVARSEKSCVESATSSRRSSTRREQDILRGGGAKRELKVESDDEKSIQTEKAKIKRRYNSSTSSNTSRKKQALAEESEPTTDDDEVEEKPDMKTFEMNQGEANEEDTIYNDSDCMIIDTVETILYALTSKRSQTCPNCNKYCKFAGNFKLHLKACMNLDDDLELINNDGSEQQKANPVKQVALKEDEEASDAEMEEGEVEEEEEDEEESESNSDNEDQDDGSESSAIPYYQKLEYRRCWECGFIVSKFHNLSRHLKQKHNISMGTKQMHAKQAEILRLK